MPEYSHIQTYVKCNEENLDSEINHFIEVLSLIGLDNKETISNFRSLKWNIEEDGSMYVGGSADTQELTIDGVSMHIRPFIMGWTPEVIKELKEPWLEVCFLLWTEEIEIENTRGQLKAKFRPIIWKLMNEIADNYNQTGVFLTNESLDGRPWEGIISNDENMIWDFEAAIIPHHLIYKFEKRINNYFYKLIDRQRLNIAKREVWMKEPW